VLRVDTIDELFAAAETLGRIAPFPGDRLAILTNGGGIGVLAVDDLMELGGKLAELSPATLTTLDAILPATWSRGNPVDIIGDAPVQRYVDALQKLGESPAARMIVVPTEFSNLAGTMTAITEMMKSTDKK
jgi:acetyltransferase